jgi:hypothetical protein
VGCHGVSAGGIAVINANAVVPGAKNLTSALAYEIFALVDLGFFGILFGGYPDLHNPRFADR